MEQMDYVVASATDSHEIIRLLATVFSDSEPPAVAMALSFEDMERFLRVIVPQIIADGLTTIARDNETGTLVGVCLTDDFMSPPSIDLDGICEKFLPIFSMLEKLDNQFRAGNAISRGEYLHLFMLAVDREFAGCGIGYGLVQACVDNGLQKGYRVALTEATGRVSQHIFRKLGFADRFSVSYEDFVYDDENVFASIREHDSAILMDRVLVRTEKVKEQAART